MQSPGQSLTFGRMIADPRTSVAFTGHRTYRGAAADALRRTVGELYARGFRTFLSGMAVGFDLAAAEAVLELRERAPGVRLVAAVPFRGQEMRFSPADRERFRRVLAEADSVEVLAPAYHQRVDSKKIPIEKFWKVKSWRLCSSSLLPALDSALKPQSTD